MKDLTYLVTRIRRMDARRFQETVSKVSCSTGKSQLSTMLDMALCAWKYGAGYMDYQLFEMYRLRHWQRDTYLTRGRNNELVRRYNDPEYFHLFDNKLEFSRKFQEFLRREWVCPGVSDAKETLAFLRSHDRFVVKPVDGSCGRGVKMVTREAYLANPERFSGLLLEERIRQHPQLNRLCPYSVNTVRIVTVHTESKTHVICAYLRVGNGEVVDNFNRGGMTAPVALTTGRVTAPAVDKQKQVYSTHPLTGTAFEGFLFPDWDDALTLVRQAARVVPQMGYIGWDVAFSADGPLLVEGNNFPGYDIYQLPAHTPDGIGIWPAFQI